MPAVPAKELKMLENVLAKHNCTFKIKLTVKSLVSAALVVLAVVLPRLVHLVAGAAGGVQWLPMYLPVLLGGCLLGAYWGLGIGVASPVVSFLLTVATGNPMPALARLPFMVAELAVFAVVSGLFTKKIAQNGWLAFPAVLLAQVSGRAAFMLLAIVFSFAAPFTPAEIRAQIQTGFAGMILQAVLVPFAVMAIRKLLNRSNA